MPRNAPIARSHVCVSGWSMRSPASSVPVWSRMYCAIRKMVSRIRLWSSRVASTTCAFGFANERCGGEAKPYFR